MPLTSNIWDAFKLRQGSREPGSFRIGEGGGASVLTGTVESEDLATILTTGIESAYVDNTTGRLRRILPMAHPVFAWHYLQSVDNCVGVSFVQKTASNPGGYLEAPALNYFSSYDKYELQATFTPRTYALVRDESIPPFTLTYSVPNQSSTTTTSKACFREYWRYIEWVTAPAAEYLTADKGQYKWAAAGGAGGINSPVDNTSAGTGQIRYLLPSATWKIIWHKVPYSYLLSTNSYLMRYIGYVNQNAFYRFSPGYALLQAVNVLRVYSPPFPSFDNWTGASVVSQNKLCDIELVILEARRDPAIAVTPANTSHIAAGHNLALFAPNGKFYYVENFRAGSAGSGKPVYDSIPFELLFQNPDF